MPVSTRVEHGNSIYSEAKISIDIGLQKNSLWKVLMALNFCMGALRMGMYLRERFFLPNKITFQKVVFWNRFTSVFIIISILSSISVDLITQTTREANLVGFAVFFLSVTIWWYLYSYFLFQGRLRILLALYHSIGTVTSFLYLLGLANIGFITNPLEMKLYQGLSSGQIIYILMSALIFSAAWVLLLVFPSPLSRGIIYRKNLL